MSKRKIFTAAALAATTALGLGACSNMGETIENQQAIISAAGFSQGTVYPQACIVSGKPAIETRYSKISYDFRYRTVALRENWNGAETGVNFNDITDGTLQAQIEAAHRLLPSTTRCPAPVFGQG